MTGFFVRCDDVCVFLQRSAPRLKGQRQLVEAFESQTQTVSQTANPDSSDTSVTTEPNRSSGNARLYLSSFSIKVLFIIALVILLISGHVVRRLSLQTRRQLLQTLRVTQVASRTAAAGPDRQQVR